MQQLGLNILHYFCLSNFSYFFLKQAGEIMELNLCPLRSSSKGNATIIFNKNTRILVDCGISGKTIEQCLQGAGVNLDTIDAIVVTHEHTDHIKGVGIISRKYNIPIFANSGTWKAMLPSLGKISDENIRIFETGEDFYIKDINVGTFSVSHDAAEPVGYTFSHRGEKVAIATDMGIVTENVLNHIQGSHTALIEANYDPNMLEIGSYPYELKRRIKGERGHLSNCDCGNLARLLAGSGTKKIILGHLSEENNYPPIAFATVKNCLCRCDTRILVVSKSGMVESY